MQKTGCYIQTEYLTLLFWQVWLCGGSIEVIPCSKIAHIERASKPYLPDLSVTMKRNALRVAEVWMDGYKHSVNIAWNLPLEVRRDILLLIMQIQKVCIINDLWGV